MFVTTKLGNICLRHNVSATMFPSLSRHLEPQSVKKKLVLIPCKFCSAGLQTGNERKFRNCPFLLFFLLRDESSRSSYLILITEEPLLTDTTLIRTSLYYGQFTWSLREQNPYKAYFSKTDSSIIRTLILVPLVSVIKRLVNSI